MNIIKNAREHREQRAAEVKNMGYKFDVEPDWAELAIGELNDLASLEIGGQTCIIQNNAAVDITRTA